MDNQQDNKLALKNQSQMTTLSFVEDSMATLSGALEYANMLLQSGMLPAHFYEKGSDGKPNMAKGKPEAVVLVLQKAKEIGMSPFQGIQQIVPINNLMTLKGDGAKALVMKSGKCDSWEEKEEGSIKEGNFKVTITAKRKDTKETLTRSFSVYDAIKAGLWIDDASVRQKSGLAYSPWYKYPARMIRYRALGYLCRDLFPDVLEGIYVEEEIIEHEVVQSVQTGNGSEVKVGNMTKQVASSLDKAKQKMQNKVNRTTVEHEEAVIVPDEVVDEESPVEAVETPKESREDRMLRAYGVEDGMTLEQWIEMYQLDEAMVTLFYEAGIALQVKEGEVRSEVDGAKIFTFLKKHCGDKGKQALALEAIGRKDASMKDAIAKWPIQKIIDYYTAYQSV